MLVSNIIQTLTSANRIFQLVFIWLYAYISIHSWSSESSVKQYELYMRTRRYISRLHVDGTTVNWQWFITYSLTCKHMSQRLPIIAESGERSTHIHRLIHTICTDAIAELCSNGVIKLSWKKQHLIGVMTDSNLSDIGQVLHCVVCKVIASLLWYYFVDRSLLSPHWSFD
jgi:hypothetical protein